MVLTAGLGVLIGGYIHDSIFTSDPAVPGVFSAESPLPIWAWSAFFALLVFVVLYFGVQISTRVQLTLALVSAAVVLAFFIKVIIDVGGDNDVATAFNPNSSTSGWSGHLLRGALRRVDLRRVRDRGEPRGGNAGAEASDPQGRARRPSWSCRSST